MAVHTRYYWKGALLLRACGSAEDPGSSEAETRREMELDVARLAAVAESLKHSREQHGSTMDHLQTSARHAMDPKRWNLVKRKERSVEAATWSWKKKKKKMQMPKRPIACLMGSQQLHSHAGEYRHSFASHPQRGSHSSFSHRPSLLLH